MSCNDDYKLYFDLVDDLDGSKYLRMKESVEAYDGFNDEINKYINAYKTIIGNKGLYIKGNWICFIYNGVPYCEKVSSFSLEWELIDYLIDDLISCGCSCVYYKSGELD